MLNAQKKFGEFQLLGLGVEVDFRPKLINNHSSLSKSLGNEPANLVNKESRVESSPIKFGSS